MGCNQHVASFAVKLLRGKYYHDNLSVAKPYASSFDVPVAPAIVPVQWLTGFRYRLTFWDGCSGATCT